MASYCVNINVEGSVLGGGVRGGRWKGEREGDRRKRGGGAETNYRKSIIKHLKKTIYYCLKKTSCV